MQNDTITWDSISAETGYTMADIEALTAEWIHEPGYLDADGNPTQATRDLLVAQRNT